MKKFLLIGDRDFAEDESRKMHKFEKYLNATVKGVGTVDSVSIDKIIFEVRKDSFRAHAPEEGIDLEQYQAIYVRSLRVYGCYVSQFATLHGIPCINDYSNYYSGSKIGQAIFFMRAGVNFLPTYYAVDPVVLTTYMAKNVGYPYILKDNNGAQGNSNYLVQSEQECRKILAKEPNTDFVAQEYCPNDRDYRILLLGDAKLIFERKGRPGTHLNNTSKGGTARQVPESALPAHIIEEAQACARKLGLIVAGFDVIPRLGTEEYSFLEVNSQPQLRTGSLLKEKQALVRQLFSSF